MFAIVTQELSEILANKTISKFNSNLTKEKMTGNVHYIVQPQLQKSTKMKKEFLPEKVYIFL